MDHALAVGERAIADREQESLSARVAAVSEEHIQRWLAYRDLMPGATMSLEQCWRLAHAWYHRVLDPYWRRMTPDEAQALFAEIGLTGPFWNLRP